MANQLSDTLLAKTFLSPLFDFNSTAVVDNSTQGKINQGALIGRVKKMDQKERKELVSQLDKAIVYIQAKKAGSLNASFYESGLCTMLMSDAAKPIPKVGIIKTLFYTFCHFVGRRISSEDILKKTAQVRAELTTGVNHLDPNDMKYKAIDQTALEGEFATGTEAQLNVLRDYVSQEGLPKVLTDLDPLQEKFNAYLRSSSSDDNKSLLEFLLAVEDVGQKIQSKTKIPETLKETTIQFIQVLSGYLAFRATKTDEVESGAKTIVAANAELADKLIVMVRGIRGTTALPRNVIENLETQLDNIKNSTQDRSEALRRIEGRLLPIYQGYKLARLTDILQTKIGEFNELKTLIENKSSKFKEIIKSKSVTGQERTFKTREQELTNTLKALVTVCTSIDYLENSSNDSLKFNKTIKAVALLISAGNHPKTQEFYSAFKLLKFIAIDFASISPQVRQAIADSIDPALLDGITDYKELHDRLAAFKTNIATVDFTKEDVRGLAASDYFSYLKFKYQRQKLNASQELENVKNQIAQLKPSVKKEAVPMTTTTLTVPHNPVSATTEPNLILIPALNTFSGNAGKVSLAMIAQGIQTNRNNKTHAHGYYNQLEGLEKTNFALIDSVYGNLFWILRQAGKVGATPGPGWGKEVFLGKKECDGVSEIQMNSYRTQAIVEILNDQKRTGL